jgi:integrase
MLKQLGPRRWLARVQYRDPRTKRKRSLERIVEGPEREARRVHAALEAEAKQAAAPRSREKLAAYARSWIASRLPHLKPSVADKYAGSLDRHIVPALGDLPVDMITPADVQGYVNDRVAAGAAGNTVLNELRLLRTMSKDSQAEGQADIDWAARVKPPTVDTYTEEDPNLLTAAELAEFLDQVPGQWRRLVELMAFTGLRWGEVSALRWSDVDLQHGAVLIRRGNWKGMEVLPKTARSRRTVPLPPGLLPAERPADVKPDALLFPSKEGTLHRGTPLTKVFLRTLAKVRAVRTEAQDDRAFPEVTPHGMRRTYNNLVRQVANREVVKAITGHTTDAMLEHYSQVGPAEKTAATARVLELVRPQVVRSGSGADDRSGDDDDDEGGER